MTQAIRLSHGIASKMCFILNYINDNKCLYKISGGKTIDNTVGQVLSKHKITFS